MNDDFAAILYGHAHFYLLVVWLVKYFFKIVKIYLTNSRRKKLPQLLDQSKRKYISIFALSANTFRSDQIEDRC